MDDLIVEFLTETNEGLQELDTNLIKLEQNPNDKELISKIFRLMHTIKGTCGFLGLPRLEKVAHHAENVMGRFRDGDLKVTPGYVSLILESLDRVRSLLGHIEAHGTEAEGQDTELIEKLDAVYEGRDVASAPIAPIAAKPETPEAQDMSNLPQNLSEKELEDIFAATPVLESELIIEAPQPVEAEAAPSHPAPASIKAAAEPKEAGESAIANQSLRVNVDVLEDLMTMVSELVLTRNQLLQIARTEKENNFSTPLQRLNHVVSDLQEGVMKTRMQPIGNAWAKLPRIIRDLSMELGKKIDLVMTGQDTELDRQVLDMIKDPLTHMVRNSGDHGIEIPSERVKAGKKETGTIHLRAFHEGGHIIIEIADDGKGLPFEKIKNKIIQNGLATADEVAHMSQQQIQQYIFHAGFSTADKVTSVSGRGVGMDVVRTNIEKIGGSIELKSVEGKGSTFAIKIPLTLAIVSSLIVAASGERFAIPQLAVRELVLVSQKSESRIEMISDTPVFRLREKLLPLVSLEQLLKLGSTDANAPTIDTTFDHKYIIVTQVGSYSFGLIVDQVFDTEEIVVKPVAKLLRYIELFSGNTILGDGSVIMILDPGGIAKVTGESSMAKAEESEESIALTNETKTSLLLFTAGASVPKAVPLSLISRLENIDLSSIERTDGQMLIQYRETLMPIIPFNDSVEVGTTGSKPLLVFADRGKTVGIIVDSILDIREEIINIQVNASTPGLVGSTIISGKATEIIEVMHYLNSVHGDWFKNHGDDPYLAQKTSSDTRRRVLLVDDSPFFRNMLCPVLTVAGYEVTAVDGPIKALALSEAGHKFDIILSDIEMPEMNGYDFASKVRSGGEWQNTPMVALTSHSTPEDIDHGYKMGFDRYIAKFDRETLLDTITRTLASGEHQA